jgi:putative membrane protein
MSLWSAIPAAALGGGLGALAACVPGLHVYNVMALGVVALARDAVPAPPEMVIPFFCAMLAAFALLNAIPSVLVAAPDESAFFTLLPGQQYLSRGRGYEACLITVLGGVAGLLAVVAPIAALAPRWLPLLRDVFRPHGHWILWSVIAFMLLSEWPKPVGVQPSGWRALATAWRSPGFGILTFLLAGWLGFLALYRSPVAPHTAFQNLMPAFVGLFTLPWLVLNLVADTRVPRQRCACALPPWGPVLHGSLAGLMGGGFAVFFPAVTAGVGGLLAGHASAIRDDRAFLASQGAAKTVYAAAAPVLLFAPGAGMVRGGGAWMLQGLVEYGSYRYYGLAVSALAIGGAVALLLFHPLTRLAVRILNRTGVRALSGGALVLAVALVLERTGGGGLLMMLTGLGIGLIPPLCGARRMNGLGVILLPIACNLSGCGPQVADWLGLL